MQINRSTPVHFGAITRWQRLGIGFEAYGTLLNGQIPVVYKYAVRTVDILSPDNPPQTDLFITQPGEATKLGQGLDCPDGKMSFNLSLTLPETNHPLSAKEQWQLADEIKADVNEFLNIT